MRENNPISNMISKMADVVLLNVLVLLGCLPVITIGASLTAGHFAMLRVKRNEGTPAQDFWRSFKENLKQATAVWLIFVCILAAILALLWFYGAGSVPLSIAGLVAMLFVYFLSLWVYPVLSRFVYPTGTLLRTGFVLSFRHLWRTIAMALAAAIPMAAVFVSIYLLPVMLLCGISLPMYIGAVLYHPVFADMEKMVAERQETDSQEQ